MATSPASMSTLPSEILSLIIGLAEPATLAVLCLLSKHFNEQITPLLYRNLVITRVNVDRLFHGLPRATKRKPRFENTSKAEYLEQLEQIKREHGEVFASLEQGAGSGDWGDNDPFLQDAESDPETDDELATQGDEHSQLAVNTSEDMWNRRLALFRHTRSITFVQVPSEALVNDLAMKLHILPDECLQEHQGHRQYPGSCGKYCQVRRKVYPNYGFDDDSWIDENGDSSEEELESGETDGAKADRGVAGWDAPDWDDPDNGTVDDESRAHSLFPALTHICFSSRVAAYLLNYLHRNSWDERGIHRLGWFGDVRITIPLFMYVVRSPEFANAKKACFSLPPPPRYEDFATYAARWALQNIGSAPFKGFEDLTVAELIELSGDVMVEGRSDMHYARLYAIAQCMFAQRVTMHNIPYGPIILLTDSTMLDGPSADPYEERTFFLSEDETFCRDTEELAQRINRIVGLPSADQKRFVKRVLADQQYYAPVRPPGFVPPSPRQYAAVAAARKERDATRTAYREFPSMMDAVQLPVSQEFIAQVKEKAPHLLPKFDSFVEANSVDMDSLLHEAERLHAGLEAAGVLELSPLLKAREAAFFAKKKQMADDEYTALAHLRKLKKGLQRQLAIDGYPRIEESMQFSTYDEADPCEVCGEKRGEERSLRDLITWARGIRH
ncbi:hypothetical protein CcaverHIS002_0505410 [Cutaneotrichosporon cavernicola]|uniref:F-box domain-containing protein n=1 Tax=Cutaneotrichosporon cavernicola TaxID=279322 RepID=A0AA48L6S7_9TREE|nr:uncharacterized protein CcaverHIS019_0505930 [Cutaneotrichosporon cavernicola]BEI85140.1 hypothetical protein CcaverHIS002_0505410 [Cutaneotrichosporon cavernicola]BEI92965.1 hypothetical protein CcaverHIS019_0505930 [Cutaneotrichosporon cavernicola]BEJ00741.1 hypothetical protein CcaverHIS631_0505980 [Cutaneotrichosporon cavernicola]BEJ08507.1 hypothetical protein CcaverHIS641_0506010 [Cutaneotrichosporon cavernicola]